MLISLSSKAGIDNVPVCRVLTPDNESVEDAGHRSLTLALLQGLPSVERLADGRTSLGQRVNILTQILGFDGWRVVDAFFE